METKVIMIASSKGGVGKSTVALGIARWLVKRGNSVLLADLDFGNACLDILLGVDDRVIYTVCDVACGKCTPDEAVLKNVTQSGLHLLPCPAGGTVSVCENGETGISADAVTDAVLKASEETGALYTVIDTGAGVSCTAEAAARIADTVLVVASHNPISLRAAEGTVARLTEAGTKDIRLIVNSFEAESTLRKKSSRKGLLDIIDLSRAPLAGVIPYDYSLLLCQEGACEKYGPSDIAFSNIASRLDGQEVPLFSGIKRIRKQRKKLYQ